MADRDGMRGAEAVGSAEEAVARYRGFATAHPAFTPGLASSLLELGTRYSEVGRRAEAVGSAEEAVTLYRQLAATNPAFTVNLALGLTNLGVFYGNVGRGVEAVGSAEEAVTLYRGLAAADPGLNGDLARALTNLGIFYGEAGRGVEAVGLAEEAVTIYRQLAAVDSAYMPNLAMSLNHLGNRYSEVGRDGEIEHMWDEMLRQFRSEPDREVSLLLARAAERSRPVLGLAIGDVIAGLSAAGDDGPLRFRCRDLLRSLRAREPAGFDAAWAAAGQDQAAWLLLDRPTLELVSSWLAMPGWSASLGFARDHLDALLDPSARVALDEFALVAALAVVGACRAVLEAAAERGVDAAYEPLLLAERADVLLSQGRGSEAEAQYRMAVGLAPGTLALRIKLACMLSGQNRLDEAQEQYRQALELAPFDPDARRGLGITLMLMGRLDDAEASLRQAIEAAPEMAWSDRPADPEAHLKFGAALQAAGHLDDAEAAYRRAILLAPNEPRFLVALEGLLTRQGKIAEAEVTLRRIVELAPEVASAHAQLGLTLQQLGRFGEAAAEYRRAMELQPQNNSAFSMALAGLFQDVNWARQTVATTPMAHPDRAINLTLLCRLLVAQYERTHDRAKVDDAIRAAEEALAIMGPDHGHRPLALALFGEALDARFELLGGISDLDRAIAAGRQAVEAVSSGDGYRPTMLANLGISLSRRFEVTGAGKDLDEGISVLREAISSTPNEDLQLVTYRSNLGNALRTRFNRSGALPDLQEAIDNTERAISLISDSHPGYGLFLSNKAIALLARFELLGSSDDLDEAVTALREAVRVTPDNHPNFASYQSNLGSVLARRFERMAELADLDDAIISFRRAAAVTPEGHPRRFRYLNNLAGALRTRYSRTGGIADLDEALVNIRLARAGTGNCDPNYPIVLAGLAHVLRTRSAATSSATDLDEAVQVAREAVQMVPLSQDVRASALGNLGLTLQNRYARTASAADLREGLDALRQAASIETAAPSARAVLAREWGGLAASGELWREAAEGYAAAVELLPRIAPRTLRRLDQEFELSRLSGLASGAVACYLQIGDINRALRMWEQGRGVLLGQRLDSWADLEGLAKQHPDMAAQFTELRDRLDAGPAVFEPEVRSGPAGREPTESARREADARRQHASDFQQLITEIRKRRGFRRFLLPPSVSELRRAASRGPVALINVSDIRSDALILTPSAVNSIPLPGLTPQSVLDHVVEFLDALKDTSSAPPEDGERRLLAVLEWLWDAVTGPVLQALDVAPPSEGSSWPRVWWCPSGLLSFLPLHASGRHETRFDIAPQTVIDRVISSYTPTVRALTHARRRVTSASPVTASGRVFVVSMPHTPGASDLPGATGEASLLQGLFGQQATIVDTPSAATHDSVLAALPHYPWAHFACHGTSYLEDPSISRLLLHDHEQEPLTVLDIMRQRLDNAELAYLSACSTARTGAALPDEAIHLASAFQLAGYRHVIATFWPIADRPAARIVANVYGVLAPDDRADEAAAALHHATRRLRAVSWAEPSVWAAFNHHGS
jgi:tetratricopeptide (TPR) repeat protein